MSGSGIGRAPADNKASNTIASNGCAYVDKFIGGVKSDYNLFKGLPNRFKSEGRNIGKTADSFLSDLGGGSFGKGVAKAGAYGVGGAMLWDMLFD